jgi:hypothetical protein
MITQLAVPCWVPSWEGDTRDDQTASFGGHYAEPEEIRGLRGPHRRAERLLPHGL